MDEGETKPCDNCKRDIPRENFTTHALHCARNIRVCGACKEPVPLADLPAHHDRMHKLQPCAQCGERVCGADLEDHVRDSCAHTPAGCRYCELELRRGALPAHERYCGARTERCAQCGAWVMHKYRQLHLDSNHGFVRLSDDPVPTENAIKTTNVPKPASSNFNSSKRDLSLPKANLDRPQTEIRYFSATALPNPNTCIAQNTSDSFTTSTSKLQNAPTVAPGPSRSPPQQASSTPNNSNASRSETNGSMSGVANPGRLAPAPMTDWANLSEQKNAPKTNAATHDRNTNSISSIGPCTSDSSGIADGLGSVSQNGAVPRAKRSNHQPQVNTASAAVPDKVNKNLWAGKKRAAPPPPDARRERGLRSALRRQRDEDARRRDQAAHNLSGGTPHAVRAMAPTDLSPGLPPELSAAAKLDKLRYMDALQSGSTGDADYENTLQGRVWRGADPAPDNHVLGAGPQDCAAPDLTAGSLRALRPMSGDAFARRLAALQLRDDRFGQIKRSLRELRRGLGEVTAPYHSAVNDDSTPNEERLPCEFCAALQPRHLLVLHQTGCRPDLTQFRPKSRSESRSASRAESRSPSPSPVIPCEFCTAPLPVYLISEHQERCGRDANLLFPD